MAEKEQRHPHESKPVGRTPKDQARNAVLLGEYDYGKYVEALTGFTGQDLQNIEFVRKQPAVRVRVGPRGNYKAGLTQMADGKLILAVCRNNNETDPAKRRFDISIYESADRGETWRQIGQTPLFGKEPCLACLPDGTLILTAQGGGPGAGIQLAPDAQIFSRSLDGGRTWEASLYKAWDYPRSLVVEPDGTLLVITAKKPGWGPPPVSDESPNLLLGRSRDGGKTWDSSEGKVDWEHTWFGEVGGIRLKDGRLLAALRCQAPETLGEGYEDSWLTESTDNGKTWKKPWPLTQTAQVHAYLTELRDGRLLCTYSNYHVPFGVSAILSRDGGRTWDYDNSIRLSVSNGYYVGWAVTLQLQDGSLITSYAATTYPEQPPDKVTCEVVKWNLTI
jgi:hypothetical protein